MVTMDMFAKHISNRHLCDRAKFSTERVLDWRLTVLPNLSFRFRYHLEQRYRWPDPLAPLDEAAEERQPQPQPTSRTCLSCRSPARRRIVGTSTTYRGRYRCPSTVDGTLKERCGPIR